MKRQRRIRVCLAMRMFYKSLPPTNAWPPRSSRSNYLFRLRVKRNRLELRHGGPHRRCLRGGIPAWTVSRTSSMFQALVCLIILIKSVIARSDGASGAFKGCRVTLWGGWAVVYSLVRRGLPSLLHRLESQLYPGTDAHVCWGTFDWLLELAAHKRWAVQNRNKM